MFLSSFTFAILTGGLIAFMGEAYRWSVLVAPSINTLSMGPAALYLVQTMLFTVFSWSFVLTYSAWIGLWSGRFSPSSFRAHFSEYPVESSLLLIVLFGGSLSFVALSKAGSNLNQVAEVYIVATSLSAICVLRWCESAQSKTDGRFKWLAVLALVLMAPFPIRQLLITKPSPVYPPTLAEVTERRAFGSLVSSLPSPVFIRDEVFALPWYSNAGKYPAITIDPVFYDTAKEKGLLEGGGLDHLIQQRFFGAMLLASSDTLYPIALKAGYVKSPLPPEHETYITVYRGREDVSLLVRPN